MKYEKLSIEERLLNHIKDYRLDQLYDLEEMVSHFTELAALTGAEVLLTDRHGSVIICTAGYQGFKADVVNEPGYKIRIENRTIAHLYTDVSKLAEDKGAVAEKLLLQAAKLYARLGQESYLHKELDSYSNDLEQIIHKEQYRVTHGDKTDALTGVLNKVYFENRRQIIDRAGIIPVAEICININDWKFVYDNFGHDESNRLIQVIAEIVKREAKQDYVIGRVDGDVFAVLISMVEDGEAADYCKRVQAACNNYIDDRLAPSVACGSVIKTNVEQKLDELYSDAEYEMFDNKYQIKNAPDYQKRLRSKLQ